MRSSSSDARSALQMILNPRVGSALVALAFAASVLPVSAVAQTRAGSVSGRVTSLDGTPIAGALVSLLGGAAPQRARSDKDGRFTLTTVAGGTYGVRVEAPGYDAWNGRTIAVREGETTALDAALARSATSLVTIGRAASSGSETLSTSSAPTTEINPQSFAAQGFTKLTDVLQDDPTTTLVHPIGGSTTLPTVVALRGPDPTETLIDVDGHQVNSGSTGSFDLSLLDPADYGSLELVRGISPSSLVGPDTIDGAINIRTLDPTATPHGLLRFSAGSFNSFGETVQSTGTLDRIGYALSLHRTTTAGEVNQDVFDVGTSTVQHVGSALDGSTLLGKLRYAFGRGDGYVGLSFHDQSEYRDLSAALTSVPNPSGIVGGGGGDAIVRHPADAGGDPASSLLNVNGFGGSSLLAHNAGYGLDFQLPLGRPNDAGIVSTTALFRHYTSLVSQSLFGPGADTSPYLYDNRDLLGDDSLQVQHQFSNSTLTLQYGTRNETLVTNFSSAGANDQSVGRSVQSVARGVLDAGSGPTVLDLAQTQRTAALRYTYDPTAALHVALATYYSNYTSFGTSIDPRIGITWTPNARTAVRASAGTTFQAPQLPELVVPATLPDPVGGYVHIGNPNLKPDHATEYGLGLEQVLVPGAQRTGFELELYRVNLRTPSSTFLPPPVDGCGTTPTSPDCPLSYPVNASDAVYQGIELEASRQLAPFTTLRAGYAVRSAYLTNVPPSIQNGSLVVGEQSLGLPLQKATISVERMPPSGWIAGARLVNEGAYNELNQLPYTTLDANLGYRFANLEVQLSATNLTNAYNQRFTYQGIGVPYGGAAGTGPIPTDAYALQGTAFNVSVSRRF